MSNTMIISAFNAATTAAQYRNAKRLAERLPVAEQFALVDTIIAARRRIEATGVSVPR